MDDVYIEEGNKIMIFRSDYVCKFFKSNLRTTTFILYVSSFFLRHHVFFLTLKRQKKFFYKNVGMEEKCIKFRHIHISCTYTHTHDIIAYSFGGYLNEQKVLNFKVWRYLLLQIHYLYIFSRGSKRRVCGEWIVSIVGWFTCCYYYFIFLGIPFNGL